VKAKEIADRTTGERIVISLFDRTLWVLWGNDTLRTAPVAVATGGTLEYQMLTGVGFDKAATSTALTATGFLSTGTLFALPLLAVPSLLLGLAVADRLARGIVLAAALGGFLFAGGATLLLSDTVVRGIGRALDRISGLLRLRRSDEALAVRLVESRDVVRDSLADAWLGAVAAALGNQGFDFLALYASVLAVGGHLNVGLVLFAFVVASTLAMIPFTPGGLGFVESGLTGVLTLAGLPLEQAVLATLLYRVFSYWLPMPAGIVAAGAFKRRHHHLT
jgi:uncharacterized protein (TIRG00374 family)